MDGPEMNLDDGIVRIVHMAHLRGDLACNTARINPNSALTTWGMAVRKKEVWVSPRDVT